MKYQPIGIFDSGYGGLTVLKDIVRALPQYDFVYLGDNARMPYGTRAFETVYQYTLEGVKYLFQKGCHLVILACNTASAKALRNIQILDLPFLDPQKRVLGIVRPTAEVIGKFSKTNAIGVLGTEGTIKSETYLLEIKKFFPGLRVSQEACPMWVPLVEHGEAESEGADYFTRKYVNRILEQDPLIDTLLLACTHYPMMLSSISKMVGKEITIVEQGQIVAASLKDYLKRHPEMDQHCSKNGQVSFYTTGDKSAFDKFGSAYFGFEVSSDKVENLI